MYEAPLLRPLVWLKSFRTHIRPFGTWRFMRIMQCNKPFFSHNAFGNADLFHHFAPFLIPRTLFELSTADRLMESVVRRSLALLRLRLVISEFIENWGDFKRYIADPLNARREAALRREQEIVAMLAANTLSLIHI